MCLAPHSSANLRAVSTETETKQLWVCTSCGFVYDPDDGDPDGGFGVEVDVAHVVAKEHDRDQPEAGRDL